MTTCRWCEIDFNKDRWSAPKRNTHCRNCKYRADDIAKRTQEALELELFAKYKTVPWDWQTRLDQAWRDDPYYLHDPQPN